MSSTARNGYTKPQIGFLRFDNSTTIRPSQEGGIIGGGGSEEPDPFNSSDSIKQVLPNISNDRIEAIENIPETND